MKIYQRATILLACICWWTMLPAGEESTLEKLATYAPSSPYGEIYVKLSELVESPLLKDLNLILDPNESQEFFANADAEMLLIINNDSIAYAYIYCSNIADLGQMQTELTKLAAKLQDMPEAKLAALKPEIKKSALENGVEAITVNGKIFILNLAPNIFMFTDAASLAAYCAIPADQLGLSVERRQLLNAGISDAQIYGNFDLNSFRFDSKFNITPDKLVLSMDISDRKDVSNLITYFDVKKMCLKDEAVEYFPDDAEQADKLAAALKVAPQNNKLIRVSFELDRAMLEKMAPRLKLESAAIQAEMFAAAFGDENASAAIMQRWKKLWGWQTLSRVSEIIETAPSDDAATTQQ